MTTIRKLAEIFGGVIQEYVDCKDFDESAPIESDNLRNLITCLQEIRIPNDMLIAYSCSPVLYNKIKWNGNGRSMF